MPEDPETLFDEYIEMWNDRQYERIPELLAEGFVMHDPPAPEEGIPGPRGHVHGRKGAELYIRAVDEAFPDWTCTITDTLVGDDRLMHESRVRMTHEGEWKGLAPTGRTVEFRDMGIVVVEDGRIRAHRVYFDNLAVAAQLGMLDGSPS